MGTVYADLTLRNEWDVGEAARGRIREEEVRAITVKAIVDTGAHTIMIDDETMRKLGLGETGKQDVRIANGKYVPCPVTTPIEINWKNRQSVMRAIAIPGLPQVLLGSLPLEEMDLVINPKLQELTGAHGDTIEYMCMTAIPVWH